MTGSLRPVIQDCAKGLRKYIRFARIGTLKPATVMRVLKMKLISGRSLAKQETVGN